MTSKILVTYSTKYGSTRGVAEAITEVLTGKYYSVDLIPSKDVNSLEGYQAVIMGAPIYAGAVLSDTVKFINRFKESLEVIPSALFILGPLDGSAQEIRGVQVQLEANRKKKFAWLKPVSTKIFTGALNLSKLRFPDSLIKLYRSNPKNPLTSKDGRDWKAINTWAVSLPEILHLQK